MVALCTNSYICTHLQIFQSFANITLMDLLPILHRAITHDIISSFHSYLREVHTISTMNGDGEDDIAALIYRESQQVTRIQELSENPELLNLCTSTSLSEEALRELIERHGYDDPGRRPVSDYDFFFAAFQNSRVTEEIIQCLLEYFPAAIRATNNNGWSPLHFACKNNVTLGIIQLLLDAAPDSVRSVDNQGAMPLHVSCDSINVDEAAAVEMLKLLIY